MKTVWLLKLGERLVLEGDGRIGRMGMLAKALDASGVKVTYWTGSFLHHEKAFLPGMSEPCFRTHDGVRFFLSNAGGYQRNISAARLRHHRDAARQFASWMSREEEKPDLIVCAYPTVENAKVALDFGERHSIPVVLDVRDLWPDIFVEILPDFLRGVGKYIFAPFEAQARSAFAKADYLTGITESVVDWAVAKTRRSRQETERAFHLSASSRARVESGARESARDIFHLEPDEPVIIFLGTFSKRVEMETVVEAVKICRERHPRYQFVLCGNGERFEEVKEDLSGCANAFMPGWIGQREINCLLSVASVGLLPYPSSLDFKLSIPNKVGDYLSGGIPVISSIDGEMKVFLEKYACGKTYQNRSPEELVNSLEAILEEKGQLDSMKRASRKTFEEHFDADRVYPEMVKWLGSLVETGPRKC